MARILAIDYGSKRMGIAVTDPQQIVATTLSTVRSHEVMHFLKKYMATEDVEAIVVGKAENPNGSPTHSTSLIEDFIKGLKRAFPEVAVLSEDERFTSKMALKAMIDSGIKKSKRREKGMLDKISAVIILQRYMKKNEIQ